MKKGSLVVISGFSGVGKGTIMRQLIQDDTYQLSVSATTRNPREGEVNGKDYYFTSVSDFQKLIENDELIEWAEYVGNYYGTPKKYVFDQMEQGKDVLLEIEQVGALEVKKKFPETVMIYIIPPSAKALKERLMKRGSETKEEICKRLIQAKKEADFVRAYDYVVVNDDLEQAVQDVKDLIRMSHFRSSLFTEDMMEFKEEIQNL